MIALIATRRAPVEVDTKDRQRSHAFELIKPDRYLINRESVQIAAILIGFFAVVLRDAFLRPFWFDELSTFFVASTPTLKTMFCAIPTDGNPPLYFLLSRLSLDLPVKAELAMRLPAILAYFGAALTIYLFVKRHSGHLFGLAAMSVFLGVNWGADFAVQARPYTLLLFFTGLVLCCWQAWCRSGNRKNLVGMTLATIGGACSHPYGVVYTVVPLAAAEIVRSLRQRRIDWPVLAALSGGCLSLVFTVPPTLRGQKVLLDAIRACPFFWAHPRFSDLKFYVWMIPYPFPSLMVLTAFALTLTLALQRPVHIKEAEVIRAKRISPGDVLVASTLALFLPFMLAVTRVGTDYFQPRYAIGSMFGLSMLSGMLVARLRWRLARPVSEALILYSLMLGFLNIWLAPVPKTPYPWTDPVLRAGSQQEPVVIASALEFSPIWWYSNSQMRSREHYLADLPFASQHRDANQQRDFVPEYSLALEHAVTPMRLDDYHEFLQAHSRFLLYCYGDPRFEWVRRRLVKSGWHVELLKVAPRPRTDDGDARQPYRELYEVTRG
jgi:nicotinamide riboside transporter PnuC